MVTSRHATKFALVLGLTGMFSCSQVNDVSSTDATISVYVHWQEMPISGKRVEVLGANQNQFTDGDGLVHLTVAPGTYTIRVYDINMGGPALRNIDREITVGRGEKKTLDVEDCLPCV